MAKEINLTNLVQHIIDSDVLPFLARYKGDAEYEGDPSIDMRNLSDMASEPPPQRIDYIVREGGTHLLADDVKLADHCWQDCFNSEPNVRLTITRIRCCNGQMLGHLADVQVKNIGKDRALRLLGLKKARVK